ncbi:MAG: hypothetical protein ABR552_10970 [Actinomycetota bacterium]|nr:hypothetical protein [Actinomycetota bacterium]
MPQVEIKDLRILDQVLADTEPDSTDIVFLGPRGQVAYPFVIARTLAGPGGTYIDACEILDADGRRIALDERRFELDGESKPRTIVSGLRDVRFSEPGTYQVQYSIFDDVVGVFPFRVVQQDAPAAGIVPGALDASLSKSTVAWLAFGDPEPAAEGWNPVEVPRYLEKKEWPVWYGYEDGRIFVLVGEGEQQIPGLLEASSVRVIARSKDKQSRVADVWCLVDTLPKDSEWDRVARDLLVGRRLNLKDGEAAVDRWKKECEIAVLTPIPPPAEPESTEA